MKDILRDSVAAALLATMVWTVLICTTLFN